MDVKAPCQVSDEEFTTLIDVLLHFQGRHHLQQGADSSLTPQQLATLFGDTSTPPPPAAAPPHRFTGADSKASARAAPRGTGVWLPDDIDVSPERQPSRTMGQLQLPRQGTEAQFGHGPLPRAASQRPPQHSLHVSGGRLNASRFRGSNSPALSAASAFCSAASAASMPLARGSSSAAFEVQPPPQKYAQRRPEQAGCHIGLASGFATPLGPLSQLSSGATTPFPADAAAGQSTASLLSASSAAAAPATVAAGSGGYGRISRLDAACAADAGTGTISSRHTSGPAAANADSRLVAACSSNSLGCASSLNLHSPPFCSPTSARSSSLPPMASAGRQALPAANSPSIEDLLVSHFSMLLLRLNRLRSQHTLHLHECDQILCSTAKLPCQL